MDDCLNCHELKTELERALAKNAELLAEIEQLKTSAVAAFDPDHKFFDLSEPFEDLHIGEWFEEEREKQLADRLPEFNTLVKGDSGKVSIQIDQKVRYDKFTNFKKRIFWYFWCQYESMIATEPAKTYFAQLNRSSELRMICDLSDIQNEPTGPNDCWEANKNLIGRKGRAELRVGGGGTQFIERGWFATRFICWLKFGFTSLTHENRMQSSHLCGNQDCLRHIHPESGQINNSRKKCHKSGCAKDCEHEPKCLFQVDGISLPCRSDPELEQCICELWEDFDCFEGVIRNNQQLNGEEPPKKKRKYVKRVANMENWNPRGPEPVTAGMLGKTRAGAKYDALWFNQRRYTHGTERSKGTTYTCYKRDSGCTGTAKIEEGKVRQVREACPHSSGCALVTKSPFT